LEETIKAYQTPIKTSKLAFEIDKTGFHPEGIMYHPKEDVFYMTDIREGMIYKTNKAGVNLEVVANLKELGFWSAMGIAVDPNNEEVLWVTTSAMPIFSGFSQAIEGRTAVLKINAQTGKLLKAYIPNDLGHLFGDLIISSSGKPYITDSNNPIIYTINEDGDSFAQAYKMEEWWNLQGLAFSDNEERLYVSDYILGIFKIEMKTGAITPLISENERLRGGDGIYQKNNQLIILQNGSNPKRIAQIRLDGNGNGIAKTLSFPDQARIDMEEPTLGTWVNSELYYIANSPWGYYDEENQPKINEWPKLNILRLKTE
jgi:DNA-binding beta-propeller fold protein YncE